MPQLLEHIDAIARKKQRDVLYLEFHDADGNPVDYHALPLRPQIIEWLNREGVGWQPCGGVASEHRIRAYAGQIYIDVPFALENPGYRKVQAYLEHPDGSMRFREATFYALPLEAAMRNAHHDDPGFWERWAERF
jgi:hypothetical protein